MTVTRISDNREFESATVAEADKKFEELARLEIGIKAKKALAEKRIAEIKAKLAADIDGAVEDYNELINWLNSYILANKGRFVKPRMRKTEFGKYGLRTASKLHINDEQALIASARENELDDIIELKYRIDKKAVEKHIAEGLEIDGAQIITGDVAGFSVSKELLDAELKR
ncbi:MAG: host-nuclease inhibitor Gam family protein [Victivallaceae bacterium]|nr:host-nuclease inhibitor Gam family protein [Victivallaceae bacterium]